MSKKGFTLVELMVVILIVAILAAVAIPIMRGRIDAAKWSEGKAMMGTIATAIRAYCAEWDGPPNVEDPQLDLTTLTIYGNASDLGFRVGDLTGTYFQEDLFSILSGTYTVRTNTLDYVIEAQKGTGINGPDSYTLNQDGEWTAGTL
ncbi:MAG TPA: prepilin-type N-terminal cleavage/methylation domain-containing protein [Planctomycetes bacterium]|nr:prepilin-type N-terminal cleavage/methylation domain-containing protein [Planctomycetota bacterium]